MDKDSKHLYSLFSRMAAVYGNLATGHGDGRGMAADIQRVQSPSGLLTYPRGKSFYGFIGMTGETFPEQQFERLSRVVFLLPSLASARNTQRVHLGTFFAEGGLVNDNHIMQLCRTPACREMVDEEMKRMRNLITRTLKESGMKKLDVVDACFCAYYWGDEQKEKIYSKYYAAIATRPKVWKENNPWKNEGTSEEDE